MGAPFKGSRQFTMNNHTFVAIDFETATTDRMACQVGIVSVNDGVIVDKVVHLIQPPGNRYDDCCINVHHITPEMTQGAPTFEELWPSISHFFSGAPIVAHNMRFDRDVLLRNIDYYGIMLMGLPPLICTCDIFNRKGLHDLCEAFGMSCEGHHDALFDAECCAQFYLNYLNGIKPDYSLITSKKEKVVPKRKNTISGALLEKDLSEADPRNPFYDRKIVITGDFSIERKELAVMLKKMGADIDTSITKKTHFVLAGQNPGPSKMEKLEKLIHDGFNIRVLSEDDLHAILKGDWKSYAVADVVEKKLDFTYEHYLSHHKPFNGLTNHIATRTIYAGKDLSGERMYFAQILGNLGAYCDNDIDNDTYICLLSDTTLSKLKSGVKDDTIKYIEARYNADKSIIFDWHFMSESDVLDYCKKRCEEYDDDVTMELYEKYMETAFENMKRKPKYEFKEGKNYCKVNGKIVLKMEDGSTWCPSRQFRGETYNISD